MNYRIGKTTIALAVMALLLGGAMEVRADDSSPAEFAVDDAAWAKSLKLTKNQKGKVERLHKDLCKGIEPLVRKRNDLNEKMLREWRAPKVDGEKIARYGKQISDLNRRIEQMKVGFWSKLSKILNHSQREAFLKHKLQTPEAGKGKPGKKGQPGKKGKPGQHGQGSQMDPFGINGLAPMQCKAHGHGPKGQKNPGKKPKKHHKR